MLRGFEQGTRRYPILARSSSAIGLDMLCQDSQRFEYPGGGRIEKWVKAGGGTRYAQQTANLDTVLGLLLSTQIRGIFLGLANRPLTCSDEYASQGIPS